MKTFNQTKVSKAVQAALGALIAVTGSVSAVASVPEVPTVDWLDATIVGTMTDEHIEVDTGWSRYDLEDVYSVQYRIDGKPVTTRAVEPGQTFGDAMLDLSVHIDHDQEMDFTIALCNADGCSETNPYIMDVTDGDDIEITVGEAPEMNFTSSSEALGISPGVFDIYAIEGLNQAGTGLFESLATKAAKVALGGVIHVSFAKVMEALGLESNTTASQIAELQDSIDGLGKQVSDITTALEALGEQSEWASFVSAHSTANAWASNIHAAWEDLSEAVAQDLDPDDNWLTVKLQQLDLGLTELTGAEGNSGQGLLDMQDGTIYQLMEAIPQHVSSVEGYWTLVDQYREYYRTALALGYLALDLYADNFDDSGAVRITANRVFKTARTATKNMYAYGIAPALPEIDAETLDFAQIRGQLTAVADEDFAVLDDTGTLKRADSNFVSWLENAVNQYRPHHHGGLTLEEFLLESGVPTIYYIDSTAGFYGTGWYIRQIDNGNPITGIAPLWGVHPRVARIEGNSLVDGAVDFCELNQALCSGEGEGIRVWYDPLGGNAGSEVNKLKNKINERKAAAWANGGFVLESATAETPAIEAVGYYASVDLTDRLNHAGRMAELDPARTEEQALGSSITTAGSLPGSDGGECIGVPESYGIRVLEVDDYNLRWQTDGNLRLRRNADDAVMWKAGTRYNADQLCWHEDGNLAIYNNGEVTFETGTSDDANSGNGGRYLKLHADGALQIVNDEDEVLWWKGTTE